MLYAGEHKRLAFPFNKAPHYGQLLDKFRVTLSGAYVHACDWVHNSFFRRVRVPITHRANLPTFAICRASCFDIEVLLLLKCPVYITLYMRYECMCVSVLWDDRQLCGTV